MSCVKFRVTLIDIRFFKLLFLMALVYTSIKRYVWRETYKSEL